MSYRNLVELGLIPITLQNRFGFLLLTLAYARYCVRTTMGAFTAPQGADSQLNSCPDPYWTTVYGLRPGPFI